MNEFSRQVAEARRGGDAEAADELVALSRRAGELERAADSEATSAGEEVRSILLELPNLPSADAPDGAGPEDNVVVRNWPDRASHLRGPPAGAALGCR